MINRNTTTFIYHKIINDFAQATTFLNFLIYAYDTTLSSTLNTYNDNIHDQNLETLINEERLKISEWLKITKLSLNVVNSKYIFQKKHIQTLNLKIDNIDIKQVIDFNCLGLIIDTNLNWNTEKKMRVLKK